MSTYTIPARPFAFTFDPAKTAVVMIDMQRDFILPGGFGETLGNDVSLLTGIVPTVVDLLAWCRMQGIHVIHTKEAHQPDLSDCPPAKRERGNPGMRIGDAGAMGRILIVGEVGSDFIPECAPLPGDSVIVKPGKGAFYATELDALLKSKGITTLLVGGVTTEVCVQTTLREANDRGYNCLLVTDATASYFPQFKESVIEMVVAQGGIVGWAADFSAVAQAFA